MENRAILGLLLAGALCACEHGPMVAGGAAIVDGDSLNIGETRIRLYGIDAPEGAQTCERDGSRWPCGEAASEKLTALVGSNLLVCQQKDIDSYGRTVAVCRNGQTDVAEEMVTAGLAIAYRRYSDDYVDAEAEAQAARRGMWAGTFTPPWDWRRNSPQAEESYISAAQQGRRDGCDIKGNINSKGDRIYHMPGWSSYEATRKGPVASRVLTVSGFTSNVCVF